MTTEIERPGSPEGSSGHFNPFEQIKHTDSDGVEYWKARELASVLQYSDYRNFEQAIKRARASCSLSGHPPDDHFVGVNEMVALGSQAKRSIPNIWMSRYACYLTIQNADPTNKPIVALGHSYFAIQTRRQELSDNTKVIDDQRRLMLREEMSKHNIKLAGAAKDAGVVEPKDYAIFQNHGYMGLYGGRTMQNIHDYKMLKKSQKILDHMGSTELAANLFRATQTEEKLRREQIKVKVGANEAHRESGKKVRQTMHDISGVYPEDLPVEESIKKLKKRTDTKLPDGGNSD